MKHRNSFAILAFSAAFLLASCGGGESTPASSASIPSNPTTSEPASTLPPASYVTVTFETNGGSEIAPQVIVKGEKATRPADPTKEGFTFDDWYADEVLATVFNFDTAISADTTIYAGWEEDEPVDSSDDSEPEEDNLIYFKDASWWNAWGAYTVAQFDEGDPAKMTHLSFNPTESTSVGYNYWSIEVPEDAETVTFYRSWDDPDQGIEMDLNGPKTNALVLDDATGNMYDISATTADWEGNPIVGEWGIYDPSDVPTESSVDDSTPAEGGDELDTIDTKYGIKNLDSGKYLCGLELGGEKDLQGRDQASALGVSFVAGTRVALCDTESDGEPTWIPPVEGWSFGGSSDTDTTWQTYLEPGEGFWTVAQNFTADIYAKFAFGNDSIYFGLTA